jgi:hypothetical protein
MSRNALIFLGAILFPIGGQWWSNMEGKKLKLWKINLFPFHICLWISKQSSY